MFDDISKPEHYNHGKIESIHVINDWNLGFCLGNTIKYICRCGHKRYHGLDERQSKIKDLEKARQYLEMEIERIKADS